MFIPIRDDAPTVRKPYLTIALMIVNTFVFLYSQALGARGFQFLTDQFGFIPYELVNQVELTPELAASPYLTMFTSMFMHGGWLHLIGNMLFLWIYGNNVEDYLGHVKFIIFYVLSGLAAVGLYTVFGPSSQVPLVGASGAIAGVMGAYLVLHPRARITVLIVFFLIQLIQLPAKFVLVMWFVIQLLMSLTGSSTGGGVAWMAHVGGFVFGWLILTAAVKITGRGGPGQQRVYRMDWR